MYTVMLVLAVECREHRTAVECRGWQGKDGVGRVREDTVVEDRAGGGGAG